MYFSHQAFPWRQKIFLLLSKLLLFPGSHREMEEEAKKRWSLEGMTALVTGGTKGIGRAIVEELASFGASVYTCARSESDLHQRLEEWKESGLRVSGSVCDVSSRPSREKLMEGVSSHFGRKLNILINNVGTGDLTPTVEVTAEHFSFIMRTNFESAYHLSQLAHPLLKASKEGSIVFVSSVCGVVAMWATTIYSATKGLGSSSIEVGL